MAPFTAAWRWAVRPIYRRAFRDAAQVAQDYGYEIMGQPLDPDPARAQVYHPVAQMVAATNIATCLWAKARKA